VIVVTFHNYVKSREIENRLQPVEDRAPLLLDEMTRAEVHGEALIVEAADLMLAVAQRGDDALAVEVAVDRLGHTDREPDRRLHIRGVNACFKLHVFDDTITSWRSATVASATVKRLKRTLGGEKRSAAAAWSGSSGSLFVRSRTCFGRVYRQVIFLPPASMCDGYAFAT
jgi:hypothetical protein